MSKELKHSKKGLIDIPNDDNKCFLWRHVRHLNVFDKNPQRITKRDREFLNKLSYGGINFPVSKKDFGKIEMLNKLVLMCFVMKTK